LKIVINGVETETTPTPGQCLRTLLRATRGLAAAQPGDAAEGRLGPEGVQCGDRFVGLPEIAAPLGDAPELDGRVAHARHDGSPRSLAFNVHGFWARRCTSA
jgi:putative selenate reductase molybdopterin-binding subunit